MNGQSYAVEIEEVMKTVFSCERSGFGGIVDSDFIRLHPFVAINSALAYQYANADENKRGKIEIFIKEIMTYTEFSIDEFLPLEKSGKKEDSAILNNELLVLPR